MTVPLPSDIAPDTPLRLDMAAALAFPDGSMTASGLRKEAARGRLVIERVAGRDYTTLSHIAAMREQCRVVPKVRVSGSDLQDAMAKAQSPTSQAISSSIKAARSALDALSAEKHRRTADLGPRDISRIPVADVLATYAADIAIRHSRPKETKRRLDRGIHKPTKLSESI